MHVPAPLPRRRARRDQQLFFRSSESDILPLPMSTIEEKLKGLAERDRLAELVPAGSVDLVLCHSLLEVVDEPAAVLRAVAAALRPGGAASVLVANRAAAVLTQAMAGHLDAAAAALSDPGGRVGPADALRRRFGHRDGAEHRACPAAHRFRRVDYQHGLRRLRWLQ